MRGKGVDGFACHPGVAQTPLYDKTDKGKPEGVAVYQLQKVQILMHAAVSTRKQQSWLTCHSRMPGHGTG